MSHLFKSKEECLLELLWLCSNWFLRALQIFWATALKPNSTHTLLFCRTYWRPIYVFSPPRNGTIEWIYLFQIVAEFSAYLETFLWTILSYMIDFFLPGGLYDARMGPYTDRHNIMCATCVQSMDFCPGHLGHIELPLAVCNPLFYSTILRMLKISCMQCHRFRVPEHIKKLYYVQQRLLDCGDIIAAQQGQLNATLK